MKDVGKRIKFIRENMNMSQERLANLTSYTSRSTIARIENGEIDIPMSKLSELANVLKVTPAYLMGWEDLEGNIITDCYREIFSKNLRDIMDEKNVSQIDLVNDLGLDKSTVSTWVNGSRLPRMDKVDMLAKYLGVKRSNLMEDKSSAEASTNSAESHLLDMFRELNLDGQEDVLEYVRKLMYVPEYKKRNQLEEMAEA